MKFFLETTAALLLSASSLRAQSIQAKNIQRNVLLTGPVVREEIVIEAQYDPKAQPAFNSADYPKGFAEELVSTWFPNYVWVVSKEKAGKLSHWHAAMVQDSLDYKVNERSPRPLTVVDITEESESCKT